MFPLTTMTISTSSDDSKENNNTGSVNVDAVVVFIIELAIIIFAIMRALRCSSNTPDSRAIHLLFATVNPVVYIAFSYIFQGFCQ